jgi:predicted O-methyltransferase YrrM
MRQPEYRVDRGRLNRSIFAALGLRPPASEHTELEGQLLREFSAGRSSIVEVGVAEGGGAWDMRQAMAADGTMWLIDPYHLSTFGRLGPARVVAHRLVNSVSRGDVRWIEELSPAPARGWSTPIDFLFIDGDHSPIGVQADWDEWTPHLADGGHVALHDAREEAPWCGPDDGPVQLLKRLRTDPGWEVVAEADSLAVLRRA